MTIYTLPRGKALEDLAKTLVTEIKDTFGEDGIEQLRDYYKRNPVILPEWPEQYVNRETGREYRPHHDDELQVWKSDTPTHVLAKGGEGSGKSCLGIVKALDRIHRGMSGVMASNDLPHFKKSLWPEFQRWCPWHMVHPKHQNMGNPVWTPYEPFEILFTNGAKLQCGGMDDPEAWRGPNVNFAFVDEVSRKKDAQVLVVLTGRIRIPGPDGEPPQIWFTTTPSGRNWLWSFFGALRCFCKKCDEEVEVYIQQGDEFACPSCGATDLDIIDEKADFKFDSRVITLSTLDNEKAGNVREGYVNTRGLTLTEMEKRVLLNAEWEDIEEGQPFLPSMTWWDQCRGEVPQLDDKTPLVIGVDAASGRQIEDSDCFAIVAVSPGSTRDSVVVRYIKSWQARRGQKIDFRGTESNPGPERELLRLCGFKLTEDGGIIRDGRGFNVKCIACDPTGLDDMIQRFRHKRVAYMKEIGQNVQRVKADTNLLRMIQERRITHDGDKLLRDHIRNADRKVDDFGHSLRLVKRLKTLRIDLSIALSQAAYVCTKLNL